MIIFIKFHNNKCYISMKNAREIIVKDQLVYHLPKYRWDMYTYSITLCTPFLSMIWIHILITKK